MENTSATPWGRAQRLDAARVSQRAGDKRFASVVELLESPNGQRLVRFAYSTDGTARRGPVTLRVADIGKLRAVVVDKHPDLADALGWGGA
ncbi:MAG: hypothetical protein JO186_07400 [Actinobacteria bacterium]|nr:hypothetical protein [Actinomycetota bacterium]